MRRTGSRATEYHLTTDQFGTQLDPPAHWAPEYPAIDELPATYAVRPLAVISIVDQVAKDPGYHLQVADIERWEQRNGNIPRGSVVMLRSDWSKDWPNLNWRRALYFPASRCPRSNFYTNRDTSCFTATSRSIPIRLAISKASTG